MNSETTGGSPIADISAIQTEAWRRSESFPAYEVSSLGRVRRAIGGRGSRAGYFLQPGRRYDGYLIVSLARDGRQISLYLHRLVCETFNGPAPSDEHQAAHRDGNKANNAPSNLYWATRIENEADKAAHGTRLRGDSVKGAKLSAEAIIDIRRRLSLGETQRSIAIHYGVSEGLVCNIVKGRAWAHV